MEEMSDATTRGAERRDGRGTRLPGLAAQRRRRALTQRRLAEMAGVAHTTISRLESRKRGGYSQTISKLATTLEVEPAVLMSEE